MPRPRTARARGRFLTALPLVGLLRAGAILGRPPPPGGAVVPGPNGQLAFASDRDGDAAIYTVAAKGELGEQGKPAKRLTRNAAEDAQPVWSPDGQHLAFVSGREGTLEGYVMDADGANPTRRSSGTARARAGRRRSRARRRSSIGSASRESRTRNWGTTPRW